MGELPRLPWTRSTSTAEQEGEPHEAQHSARSPTAGPAWTVVHIAAGHCMGLGSCARVAGTQDAYMSLLPSEMWSWAHTREAGTGLGGSAPHAVCTALSKLEQQPGVQPRIQPA